VSRLFHVTSVLNRESIEIHGLDWSKMGVARGIAGSHRPEEEGCFVCFDEMDAHWFVRMNNTDGPVDVWAIDDLDEGALVVSGEGFSYFPGCIPADKLTLVQRDLLVDRF
jgi:hypothetical protein